MPVIESKILMDSIKLTDTTANNGRGSTVTATYRLTCDVPMMPAEARNSAYTTGVGPNPLPRRYDPYAIYDSGSLIDSEPGIYCRTLSFGYPRQSGRTLYDVDVTWANLDPGQQPSNNIENPLLRPTIYSVERQIETVAIEKAELVSPALKNPDGTTKYTSGETIPIVNAALRPFEDTLYRDETILVFVARRNVSNYLNAIAVTQFFENTSNSDELPQFDNAPAGTLAFRSCETGEPIEEGMYSYYVQTTKIAHKKTGWDKDIANVGMVHYWNETSPGWTGPTTTYTDNETLRKFREQKQLKSLIPDEPRALTPDGFRIEEGSGTDGNYITYRDLPRVSYAAL